MNRQKKRETFQAGGPLETHSQRSGCGAGEAGVMGTGDGCSDWVGPGRAGGRPRWAEDLLGLRDLKCSSPHLEQVITIQIRICMAVGTPQISFTNIFSCNPSKDCEGGINNLTLQMRKQAQRSTPCPGLHGWLWHRKDFNLASSSCSRYFPVHHGQEN